MKKQIFALTVILLITLGMTSCGSKSSTQQSEPTTTEQMAVDTSSASKPKDIVYQCPMKCEGEKTYDQPGKCPKCGMDLKEKEGNEGHDH